MGGLGRSLEIAGHGDAEALHEEVTRRIVDFLSTFTAPDVYDNLTPYLGEARYSDSWGGSDTLLDWSFTDGGGGCTRSKYLWAHWLAIAFSADRDAIETIARAHGFEIVDPRWPLAVGGDDGFVELRGNVWVLMDEALVGDSVHIPIDELDADEKAVALAARTACACGPCRQLTPEPRIARTPEQQAADVERAERKLVAGMMAAHARGQRNA